MQKLLITYATRPLGLRLVNLLGTTYHIEKSTSDEVPSILRTAYLSIPNANNPVFVHELLKLALDQGCEFILPIGMDEIQVLAAAKELFEEYGIHILCPDADQLPDLNYVQDPEREIPLSVIFDQVDMVSGREYESAVWNGLCLVADSNEDFILVGL